MFRRFDLIRALALFALLSCWSASVATTAHAQLTVTFENDLTLSSESYHYEGSFTSSGIFFDNEYSNAWGPYWEGWAYSNTTDITTPGYDYVAFQVVNQSSAFVKVPDPSNIYAVAHVGDFLMLTPPSIARPTGLTWDSIDIANSTYAALSMRDGDPPGGFGKKFNTVDADWFLLTISGYDSNGHLGDIEFYLADFRDGESYIVDDWTTVSLLDLAHAEWLEFTLSSSDNDLDWGYMNTPAYFALDNVTFAAVPEPGSLLLGSLAAGGLALRRLRRRKQMKQPAPAEQTTLAL